MGVMTFGFAEIHHPVWPVGNSLRFEFRHMHAISFGSFVSVIPKVLDGLFMSFPFYQQKILLSQRLEIMVPIRIHFVLSRSMLLLCCILFFFLHIREAKVQIMKKTCVWRLLACSSNKISNLLTDMWTNEETTVWFMRCFILLDTATIRHLVVCENLFWNLLVTFITDIAGYFCCACNKLQK